MASLTILSASLSSPAARTEAPFFHFAARSGLVANLSSQPLLRRPSIEAIGLPFSTLRMPYALPSPSTSPPRTISTSPSRTDAARPLRHHMRSQSSDSVVSTSFIYVHPASPDAKGEPHSWSPSSPIAGPSMGSLPRKSRRSKLFGFTPAADDGPSSQEASPAQGDEDDATPTGLTDSPVPASPTLATASMPPHGPPLVPVRFRPVHPKAASTPAGVRSLAAELSEAFPEARQTAMLRKKSGELVRSSLKTDFGRDRAHKPRSEPATPTCPKYVHFDTQLEHVKHFLSQQRPAAVSRSGSPVETETEDEPEAFPFPAMASAQAGALQIRLPNFPTRINHSQDAYVESIEVAPDGKSLRGVVRVRNLAFEKWVAVRFTMDNWQTVSEVSGEHLESMGPMSDRFVFSIKLQDLLSRIEEKTMFVAVRYTVGGREIWDNNDGANYRIEFVKATPQAPGTSAPKRQTWSVTNAGQAADRMADLRRELDRLVKDDLDPSPLHVSTRSFTEGTGPAFSTRYDFGNSLKMFAGRQQPVPTATPTDGLSSSPTKPVSPYISANFVHGMPATVFPDPTTSPTLTRSNLAPDFGSYVPPGGLPYPRYHTQVQRPPSPPAEGQLSPFYPGPKALYHQRDSTTAGAASRSRFNSFPSGQPPPSSQPYAPLLPPSFRDHRRKDSPYGSPAESPAGSPGMSPALSPAMSPAMSPQSASPPRPHSPPLYETTSPEDVWSPSSSIDTASTGSTESTASSRSTSTYSPDSKTTSMPDSPLSGFPSRPSGPSEFSSFLDRYYFHQSAASSGSDGSGTPLPSDFSTTPRRVTPATATSCAQSSYNYSPASSGASTPNRDDPATTPMDAFSTFIGLGPPAIAG